MAATLLGPLGWEYSQDEEGHREYRIHFLIASDRAGGTTAGGNWDGPQTILAASGLPAVGDAWNYFGDSDAWAFCRPNVQLTPYVRDNDRTERMGGGANPKVLYRATFTFSTKLKKSDRCQDDKIEDPLAEPPQVSGSFATAQREMKYDIDGDPLMTSSHEPFTGDDAMADVSKPTVRITQNVADLQLSTVTNLMQSVNNSAMWGLPARFIKLSGCSWERKYWGSCNAYYTRTLEFEIDNVTEDKDGNKLGWDRKIPDMGTRCIMYDWHSDNPNDLKNNPYYWRKRSMGDADPEEGDPDPDNPKHFKAYQDLSGNYTSCLLNGSGEPIDDIEDQYFHDVRKYKGASFSVLGIPTSL
jgi:hypothetical protein